MDDLTKKQDNDPLLALVKKAMPLARRAGVFASREAVAGGPAV